VAKLTINQALLQGFEAHKVGRLQEAYRIYATILKVQPNHPDANHNTGVLTVAFGKIELALPFFKNALEANPNTAQFWHSYIDALIKVKRLKDAKALLDQAKSNGAKGDGFDQLEQRLIYANKKQAKTNKTSFGKHGGQPNIQDTLNLDHASRLAKKRLSSVPVEKTSKVQDPPQNQLQLLTSLYSQGQNQEALEQTKAVLQHFPYSSILHNICGAIYVELGQLEASVKAYNKAISIMPDYADAYYNMGIALKAQGKQDESIEAYRKALAIKPDYADACNNLGNTLNEQGKFDEAITFYKRALAIKPDYAETYFNMGRALKDQGKLEEAIKANNKALAIKPDYAEAYYTMGIALKAQGKQDESIEAYRKALAIKPDYADACNNLGNTLNEQGKFDEAITFYKRALAIKPDYAETYFNMGRALKDQGKLEEAIKANNKAIAIKPYYAEAHYNNSVIYNLKGEIQQGLKLYEWRFKVQENFTTVPREKLYWNRIEPIKGKEFLVYEEQGIGDIIQFCRYLPRLVSQGAKVTFKVKKNLHTLLRTLSSEINLVDSFHDVSQIDFEAPLMSLPYLFNTNLETIPKMESYLSANHVKVVSWGKILSAKKFKIGICWQGSKNKIDIGRSFPLSLFESISKLPNVELISLHKGEGEEQIRDIKFDLTTFDSDFDAGKDAFLDTAAIMANCDLIITSDTAVAHLAGSLGYTTWLALKYVPDWRWMINRPDSPWYPTLRLYRQIQRDNWEYTFVKIQNDLKKLLNQHGDLT